MLLGLFFTITLLVNYLQLMLIGKNYLTSIYKKNKKRFVINLLLLNLIWVVAGLLTFALRYSLFTPTVLQSVTPLVFVLFVLLLRFTVYLTPIAHYLNDETQYSKQILLTNTLLLSMLFLSPLFLVSFGQLLLLIALSVLTIALSTILSYYFYHYLTLIPLNLAWKEQPIILFLAALLALTLVVVSHF